MAVKKADVENIESILRKLCYSIEKLQNSIDLICLKIEKQEHHIQHEMLKYKIRNIFLILYPLAIFVLIFWANWDHEKVADTYEDSKYILENIIQASKYIP
jgi:hypothetical protein